MTDSDRRIIAFVKWIKDQPRDVQRRFYASFYYDCGPINDLMEAGWPAAVQHDYPEKFPED